MEKQIYELSNSDLLTFGAWYFPMDSSVEDELTVRPVYDLEQARDFQVIVRSKFQGSNGIEYLGYVYWGGEGVENLQPTILLEDGGAVNFWNGMRKPSWNDYPLVANVIKDAIPIICESEFLYGLPSISVVLKGLAYIEGDAVCWVF